jgi:hypothetical protein
VLKRAPALLFPPAVVLGSAHELYLRNQRELHQTVAALFPFWVAAAAAIAAGLLLQRLDGRGWARAALWAFYAAGLAFLLWGFLRGLPLASGLASWTLDTGAGSALFAAGGVAATVVAARRFRPRSLEPFLAVLGVLLTAREAVSLATRLDLAAPPSVRDIPAAFGGGGGAGLPNVYHVLLDSLPRDLFDACLPPGGEETFDGFVRVRLDAPMRHTMMVLPQLLTGRWAVDSRRGLGDAIGGKDSLFSDFRRAGYRSVGFVPSFLYRANRPALDTTVYLDESVFLGGSDTARIQAMDASAFRQLWAYSVLPLALGQVLARGTPFDLDAGALRSVEGIRLSALAQPVVSKMGLERFLEVEPLLPPHGRYTFVHLLLPHPPPVLRSDCSYAEGDGATDLKQQTECTLRLVSRLLETLRGLGRLDASVVLIHGDHGATGERRDGRIVNDPSAELRTVLLAKAVGARGPMRRARETAVVVDVAPTLLALATVRPERALDGRVLAEVLPGEGSQGLGGAPAGAPTRLQTTDPPPVAGPGRKSVPSGSHPSGGGAGSTTWAAPARSRSTARSAGVAP